MDFVRHMGWTHVGLMSRKLEFIEEIKEYSSGPFKQMEAGILDRAMADPDGKWDAVNVIGPDSGGAFNQGPERLPMFKSMNGRMCFDDYLYNILLEAVRSMKNKARVIILNIPPDGWQMWGIFNALNDLDMLNGEYVFIIPSFYMDPETISMKWATEGWIGGKRNKEPRAEAVELYAKAMKHTFHVFAEPFTLTPVWESFANASFDLMSDPVWEESIIGTVQPPEQGPRRTESGDSQTDGVTGLCKIFGPLPAGGGGPPGGGPPGAGGPPGGGPPGGGAPGGGPPGGRFQRQTDEEDVPHGGIYHYHGNLNCSDAGAASGANDPDMCVLLGYYLDGVPVYGLCKDQSNNKIMTSCYSLNAGAATSSITTVFGTYNNLGGNQNDYTYASNLDCNLDEASGALHPTTGKYSYFMTTDYPWIPIKFMASRSTICGFTP